MATGDRQSYILAVAYADLTPAPESIRKNNPQEFYAEIGLDQTTVQTTPAVVGGEILFWHEDISLNGTSSSTISLSIVPNASGSISNKSCVCSVDVTLGTLLARCAGDQYTSLEMTSPDVEENGLITIRVELREQVLHDPASITIGAVGDDRTERIRCLDNLSDLDVNILNGECAVVQMNSDHLTRTHHPTKFIRSMQTCVQHVRDIPKHAIRYCKVTALLYAIARHSRRFSRLREIDDLDNVILTAGEIVNHHPNSTTYMCILAAAKKIRFDLLGDLSDLENAISNQQLVAELTSDRHPDKPHYLSTLGTYQTSLFERLGKLSDLDNAILNQQTALKLTRDGHVNQLGLLLRLGAAQQIRFERLDNLSDLENAISNQQRAVALTNNRHPDQLHTFWVLGTNQRTPFERLGKLSDLDNAIFNQQMAAEITSDGHSSKPNILLNLGNSQRDRFKFLGNLSDLDNAISNQQKAIELAGESHALFFSNLAESQIIRFEKLQDFSDLANANSHVQRAIELTDDSHLRKPALLSILGKVQKIQFCCLGDLSVLDTAISNQQKAVEIAGDSHPRTALALYLSNLSGSQRERFKNLDRLSDLKHAISNQQRAIELADDGHQSSLHFDLGNAQQLHFWHSGNWSDLDNAVSNLQRALKLGSPPNNMLGLSTLAVAQLELFMLIGDLSNLGDAISNMQRAVELTNDSHPDKPVLLIILGDCQRLRSKWLGEQLSDSQNQISNQQKAVGLARDNPPKTVGALSILSNAQMNLFERFGDFSNLMDAISNRREALELSSDGTHLLRLAHAQYARFAHLGDLSDLESAISNMQKAFQLTNDKDWMKGGCLSQLAHYQYCRFQHLGNSDDLAACVSSYKAAAQLKAAPPSHALGAARLWAQISHCNGDLPSALDGYRKAVELLPMVAWLGLNAADRQCMLLQEQSEKLACLAATCAIQLGCLEEAVEFLDRGRSIFWDQLSSLRSDLEPLREEDAALVKDFEGLCQQLDVDSLSSPEFFIHPFAVEPTVGPENPSDLFPENFLDDVNRIIRNIDESTINLEKFQHRREIGRERRRLVYKWEELVERIRELPRFKYFLRSIPFHQLRQACMAGQVVIINISIHGADALIFSTNGPIEHVPLSDVDLETITELSQNIVSNQPANGSDKQRQRFTTRFLNPALRTIWNDVLTPIFKKIHISLEETTVVPRRRIWWYPTGPLTLIPIHAAGSGHGISHVCQLVDSSYVTTLESLLRAQKKNVSIPKENQNFLFVSQPETPGHAVLPQTTEEVNEIVQILGESGWPEENIVCLSGAEATVDTVSVALGSHSWVHLACHGAQDSELGMKSAFALHDGYLGLCKIASKRLINSRFALLSTCQAASGQKDLPGEAIHLAAGLQLAGFPSVIATLWKIRDDDAQKVAVHMYRFLLRNGLEGLDPSDATSALNHAILCLREDPSVTVDRWAPFIHFGI